MWALIIKLNKGNSLREITNFESLNGLSPIKKEMNNNAPGKKRLCGWHATAPAVPLQLETI